MTTGNPMLGIVICLLLHSQFGTYPFIYVGPWTLTLVATRNQRESFRRCVRLRQVRLESCVC